MDPYMTELSILRQYVLDEINRIRRTPAFTDEEDERQEGACLALDGVLDEVNSAIERLERYA